MPDATSVRFRRVGGSARDGWPRRGAVDLGPAVSLWGARAEGVSGDAFVLVAAFGGRTPVRGAVAAVASPLFVEFRSLAAPRRCGSADAARPCEFCCVLIPLALLAVPRRACHLSVCSLFVERGAVGAVPAGIGVTASNSIPVAGFGLVSLPQPRHLVGDPVHAAGRGRPGGRCRTVDLGEGGSPRRRGTYGVAGRRDAVHPLQLEPVPGRRLPITQARRNPSVGPELGPRVRRRQEPTPGRARS